MYIVEWLEAHKLLKSFYTYKEAEDFAFGLMQSDLIVVSIYQSY